MKYSSNNDRSNSLNPNNKAYEASMVNRARQLSNIGCYSRIFICDKSKTRAIIEISTIYELHSFIGREPVLKADAVQKSCTSQCFCRIDLNKTCEKLENFYIDIGDKDDCWSYLIVKS